MLFDTSAYYGQPGVLSSPFVQQGLFGHLPGQPTQPIWPMVGGGLGHPQLAGCVTPGLLGYVPGQYASPIWPTIGALGQPPIPSFVPPPVVPGPFGLPTAPTIGGWLGQLLAAQFGVPVGPFGRILPFETGLPTMAAPGFGIAPQFGLTPQIGGWLPQPHLASALGRSIIPYQTALPQTVPQMVYAGV